MRAWVGELSRTQLDHPRSLAPQQQAFRKPAQRVIAPDEEPVREGRARPRAVHEIVEPVMGRDASAYTFETHGPWRLNGDQVDRTG
jgi:hypothetical protein